jgi:hypothetical protein
MFSFKSNFKKCACIEAVKVEALIGKEGPALRVLSSTVMVGADGSKSLTKIL